MSEDEKAYGTFACPICGRETPHRHDKNYDPCPEQGCELWLGHYGHHYRETREPKVWSRDAVYPRIAKLEADLAAAREDVVLAAGELLVPIPTPGTRDARLLAANTAMRRQRDAAIARAERALHAVNTLKADLAAFDHEVKRLEAKLADRDATILKMREVLTALVVKWCPHCGSCCVHVGGEWAVTERSCVCDSLSKQARAALAGAGRCRRLVRSLRSAVYRAPATTPWPEAKQDEAAVERLRDAMHGTACVSPTVPAPIDWDEPKQSGDAKGEALRAAVRRGDWDMCEHDLLVSQCPECRDAKLSEAHYMARLGKTDG